jgi:hypothetical protein
MTVSVDVTYIKGVVMVTRRKDTKWSQYLSLRNKLCRREEVNYENICGQDAVTGHPFQRTKRIIIITVRNKYIILQLVCPSSWIFKTNDCEKFSLTFILYNVQNR